MIFCQPLPEKSANPDMLTTSDPYATLAKPTRDLTIYETLNQYRIHRESKQIERRDKRQFYIYKHI